MENSTYTKTVIALHRIRDRTKEALSDTPKTNLPQRFRRTWVQTQDVVRNATNSCFGHPPNVQCEHIPEKYRYIFRKKSLWEMTVISSAVCGIEFCYAIETAFVTPLLLSLGLEMKYVAMFWSISPIISFLLTPILGSLSDTCKSRFGRRRPFIFFLALGILLGLLLVPYGRHIGMALGDNNELLTSKHLDSSLINRTYFTTVKAKENKTVYSASFLQNLKEFKTWTKPELFSNNYSNFQQLVSNANLYQNTMSSGTLIAKEQPKSIENPSGLYTSRHQMEKEPVAMGEIEKIGLMSTTNSTSSPIQTWSLVFTVLGAILIDSCADISQSPCRTYLLDISTPAEQANALSIFSTLSGLGACLGYIVGAINWHVSIWGNILESQIIVVFSIITIVFVVCMSSALSSFPEIPLTLLQDPAIFKEYQVKRHKESTEGENEMKNLKKEHRKYSSENATCEISVDRKISSENNQKINNVMENVECPQKSVIEEESFSSHGHTSLSEYLKSLIYMPKSLRILCLTNFFCWMANSCYFLYFTDFVGEYIYRGDPHAPEDSESYLRFKDGVRFGCWGSAVAALSCSFYSFYVEKMVKRFGAKPVYISGCLIYSVGMVIMAVSRHPVAVIILSATAGVLTSTNYTMPYILVAHYHEVNKFGNKKDGSNNDVRGIGTDVAVVTSMIVLSQFILSFTMGSIVELVGSNVGTVGAAAFTSACAAGFATQVMYLDL